MRFDRSFVAIVIAAASLAASGCAVMEIEDQPCPSGGTALTYESFGKNFMAAWCNTCHSAESGDRRGAPEDYAFGTIELVREHEARIFARSAGSNDSMPPGPDDPPREERDKLAEWLACGAP